MANRPWGLTLGAGCGAVIAAVAGWRYNAPAPVTSAKAPSPPAISAPATPATAAPAAAPAKVKLPKVEPAKAEPPKPAAPVAEAPKAEAAKPDAPKPQAPAAPAAPPPSPAPEKLAAAAPPPAAAPVPPTWDVLRVAKDGSVVCAAHAMPGAATSLLDGDATIATDKADGASGDVVLTPDPLAPGRHVLRLSEVVPATGAKLVSVRTAVVDVVKGGVAAVAMLDQGQAMPPAPTVQVATATATASVPVAAKPQAAPAPVPAPAAAPSPFVRLGAVTIGADGQLDVAGAAPPDAHLKLSLNDTFLADATADAGGGFSLSIKTGVVPGKYLLRVEEVDPATGAVLAQAQSAFEYVGEAPKVAAAPAPAAPAPRPAASKTAEAAPSTPAPAKAAEAAPAPAHVVVPAIGARTVVAGDNLWNIAKSTYGDGLAYRKIYAANRDKIRKPRLIFPGQVFVMPEKPAQ